MFGYEHGYTLIENFANHYTQYEYNVIRRRRLYALTLDSTG